MPYLAYLQTKGFTCTYNPLKDNHQGLPCAEVRIFNTKGQAAFNAAFKAVESFNQTWNQMPVAATPSPATRLSSTAKPFVHAPGGAAATADDDFTEVQSKKKKQAEKNAATRSSYAAAAKPPAAPAAPAAKTALSPAAAWPFPTGNKP